MTIQRWYIAVLVISSKVTEHASAPPAVDLQYRALRAATHEDAYQRALTLGQQQAQSYPNAEGDTVLWECVGLHDLREIDDVDVLAGTEVYSQIVRDDPGSYVVSKERLSAFWLESNKDKTAADILDKSRQFLVVFSTWSARGWAEFVGGNFATLI